MAKIFCDQFCGTAIHFENGVPHNDRDGKVHDCYIKTRAREFEGYYNMIQIKYIRERIEKIRQMARDITVDLDTVSRTLDWQEEQNKPWAEAFTKRKEAGRQRNYEQ